MYSYSISHFSIVSRNLADSENEARLGSERSDDKGWEDGFETTMSHDAASCASLHLRCTSRVVGFAHSTDWPFHEPGFEFFVIDRSVNGLLNVREILFFFPWLVCRWPHYGLRLMIGFSSPRVLNGAWASTAPYRIMDNLIRSLVLQSLCMPLLNVDASCFSACRFHAAQQLHVWLGFSRTAASNHVEEQFWPPHMGPRPR